MYPDFFSISVPEFLKGMLSFLPEQITVHAYGTLVALFYTEKQSIKIGVKKARIIDLFIWVFIAAYIGGRFFHFFEKPDYYFGDPANMLTFSGSGFVFYGSLIFAIPALLIFFKVYKMPGMQMIDIIAFVAVIVHIFGRMGCFMAGCCHGIPTDSFVGVTFTHANSQADPLGVPLHPTQLYSVFMLLIIFVVLIIIKNRKMFAGQLFLTYVVLYAVGRSVIEEFRGDEIRGFIFNDFLSHSQLISLITGTIAGYFYWLFYKKAKNNRVKIKLN